MSPRALRIALIVLVAIGCRGGGGSLRYPGTDARPASAREMAGALAAGVPAADRAALVELLERIIDGDRAAGASPAARRLQFGDLAARLERVPPPDRLALGKAIAIDRSIVAIDHDGLVLAIARYDREHPARPRDAAVVLGVVDAELDRWRGASVEQIVAAARARRADLDAQVAALRAIPAPRGTCLWFEIALTAASARSSLDAAISGEYRGGEGQLAAFLAMIGAIAPVRGDHVECDESRR